MFKNVADAAMRIIYENDLIQAEFFNIAGFKETYPLYAADWATYMSGHEAQSPAQLDLNDGKDEHEALSQAQLDLIHAPFVPASQNAENDDDEKQHEEKKEETKIQPEGILNDINNYYIEGNDNNHGMDPKYSDCLSTASEFERFVDTLDESKFYAADDTNDDDQGNDTMDID